MEIFVNYYMRNDMDFEKRYLLGTSFVPLWHTSSEVSMGSGRSLHLIFLKYLTKYGPHSSSE